MKIIVISLDNPGTDDKSCKEEGEQIFCKLNNFQNQSYFPRANFEYRIIGGKDFY